jgi:hypothetical protein
MDIIKIALKANELTREYSVRRFEELFEIRYFPHLEFANWKVERWVRAHCERAYKKGYIGQLALWLGKLHGPQIENAAVPDLSIRWINEHIGYGAFTARPFKKWEYIGEYTGILRRRKLLFPDINDYCFMYPREGVSFKPMTIDSDKQGSLTRFINHSDCPNCESVSVFHGGVFHIIFRAIQDIPADTELKYDYGDIYWRRRKKLPEDPIETLIDPNAFKALKDSWQGFGVK